MILLFQRFWGNHFQFQLLDDIDSIISIITIQAKQLKTMLRADPFPLAAEGVVCSSPPFTSAQISRSPSWREATYSDLIKTGLSHLHLTPLLVHGQSTNFCCQLKTINHIRVLGKFSRSFSVIFDTLWLIRSFSTGNCSWIPLINAPVPGRSQFWIPEKLRLLNHRSHCSPGLLPAENLHCLLEDLEFCGTRQRRWHDIKRTRVLKHPKNYQQ